MEELLSLKWNNHRSTFLHILTILRDKQLYTDATLACEGRFYSVHRLVLSTCSDYFSAMFDRTNCKNPIIVLKDIKCEDLESLLDYMYLGEVNVRQADLASLIKAAECLRVKGLAVPDDEPPSKRPGPASKRSDRSDTAAASPPPKRKRRSVTAGGEESITESRQSPPPSRSQDDRRDAHSTDGDLAAVKIEPSESEGDPFALDDFKAEITDEPPPSGNDLSNDLPELLDQSGDSFSQSFAGPSSFQPDLQGWQGDQGLSSNNFSGGAFPSQSNTQNPSQDNSQNASGESRSSPTASAVSSVASVLDAVLQASSRSFVGTFRQKAAPFAPVNRGSFHCTVCSKSFVTGWELRRHLHAHSGARPFKCPYCSHRSNFKHNLKSHVNMVHRGLPFDFTIESAPP